MYKLFKSSPFFLLFLFVISFSSWAQPVLKTPADSVQLARLNTHFSFIIANDLGRNGYYDQKPIAEMMGQVANLTGAGFIAALGDVHHFMGVQSVNDPLWLTNYELTYSHPALMIPWYPVLGNHEYRGNTTAVLDYSKISRRWQMSKRYYSKTIHLSDSTSLLLVFIDTTPLIDKYHNDPMSDASKQNREKQLNWIDSTLVHSNAKWKIVMGHHPIYAGTLKDEIEQTDLQKKLKPILVKNNTDLYISGHIHIFQHLKFPDSAIDYIVNSSASLDRPIIKREGILFNSAEPGFLVCSPDDSEIKILLIDKNGKIIYSFNKTKEKK